MASNDTAALVVALSAQVSKFQKDMDQAAGIADKSVKQIENRFSQFNRNASNQLSSFAQNASSRLGIVGDVLTALGPIGLGVAASVGVLALAYITVADKVDAFAEKAKRLKDTAETTGLTITQLRLLSTAGKQAGLDFESTEKFIERLSVALDELKTKSSGPLFDALIRISTGLVRQVASSKDTAAAIDILAKAYAELTDQQQKNALVAAITGKRNLVAGRLLDIVAEKDGLKGLQAESVEAGKAIDEELITKITKLKREIEAIKARTDNIWGSTFSLTVLEEQKKSAEFWERIAVAVSKAATFNTSFERTNSQASQFGRRFRGADIPFTAGREESTLTAEQLIKSVQGRSASQLSGASPGMLTLGLPKAEDLVPLATQLELMKKWTSVLGEAITPTEAFKLKVLELSVAQDKGGVSDQVRTRALAAFTLSQGAAALSTRERLGIAKEEEITEQRLKELNDSRAKGFVKNAAEMALAEQIIAREAKASAEALKVRASNTPELTRALLDAQNATKQFDQIATAAFNSAGDAFADVVTGTKTVKDAIHDMVNSLIRDLSRAAFKSLLGSLIGGATGGGNIFAGLFGGARAGGGPVSAGNAFAVGENGPEIFVPNSAGTIIPNDVLHRGGGGLSLTIAPMIDARGADSIQVARIEATVDRLIRELPGTIVTTLNDARRRSVRV